MDEVGLIISKLRKRKGMSQENLASLAGVSQATISRLEKMEQVANIKTLAKLARALDVGLSEFVPQEVMNADQSPEGTFFAFCANPFCVRNKYKLDDNKTPTIYWDSWQSYASTSWTDVNFCRSCGEDLVKECSGCGGKITEKNSRFCTRCGVRFSSRPTAADWEKIEALLKPKESEFDDDIPF